MEIRFQGLYTWHDLFNAVLMANKPTRRKALSRLVMGILVVGLYFIYVLFLAMKNNTLIFDKASIGQHLFTLFAFVLFMIYPTLSAGITTYKLWRSPIFRKPFSGTLSEEGILYTGKITTITWDRITKKVIADDMIVLLTSDGILSFFPRGFFFSEGDWQRAIQLVTASVVLN